MAALGRKTETTPIAAGLVDPLQEASQDPWRVAGAKGTTVTFEDEP